MITEDQLDGRSLLVQADRLMEDQAARDQMAQASKRWAVQMQLIA